MKNIFILIIVSLFLNSCGSTSSSFNSRSPESRVNYYINNLFVTTEPTDLVPSIIASKAPTRSPVDTLSILSNDQKFFLEEERKKGLAVPGEHLFRKSFSYTVASSADNILRDFHGKKFKNYDTVSKAYWTRQ